MVRHTRLLCPPLPSGVLKTDGDIIQPSHPLLPFSLSPSIFGSIRVFSNESTLLIRWPEYWTFSCSGEQELRWSFLFVLWICHVYSVWDWRMCGVTFNNSPAGSGPFLSLWNCRFVLTRYWINICIKKNHPAGECGRFQWSRKNLIKIQDASCLLSCLFENNIGQKVFFLYI